MEPTFDRFFHRCSQMYDIPKELEEYWGGALATGSYTTAACLEYTLNC